jgi:hypothetical protein
VAGPESNGQCRQILAREMNADCHQPRGLSCEQNHTHGVRAAGVTFDEAIAICLTHREILTSWKEPFLVSIRRSYPEPFA